ncbi:xanthine dehydrogenase family protein subunit M [Burkholderia sp. Ax-1720]|uniref:FAD binding domain-containing protein n=2 Tax=unclassified Burkholderia TaxID=2613784 RepID=UPI00141E03C2|nr:xanthine dehydrogenase family protein subunit M [Burkholderia sp. Ax-1720]NIF94598.1 xanthine dehydrogenase family protein subunit M [Burkholderia sp. Ax-1720]
MRTFGYTRPDSVPAAIQAFAAAGPGARYLGGGTTLYDLMKLDVEHPRHLIDITAIAGIDAVEAGGQGLRIGALATMSEVAAHPVVLRDYPVLAESLDRAASQQLRNMATVGGNLLQRTRCPYFRNGALYPCNKRVPGSGCAAIGGLDRSHAVLGTSESCIAVYPGDWAVALAALDASIEVAGAARARRIPLLALHRLPGSTPHLEHVLELGEMIVAIHVPATPAARASTYHKIRDRESYAFALVSAAVALELRDGVVREARIALGGVATKPWRAGRAERSLLGRPLDAGSALAAGRLAFAEARPGTHNGFKIELGARAVADALEIAGSRA